MKAVIDMGSGISLDSPIFSRILEIQRYREWEESELMLAYKNPLVPDRLVRLRIYVNGWFGKRR